MASSSAGRDRDLVRALDDAASDRPRRSTARRSAPLVGDRRWPGAGSGRRGSGWSEPSLYCSWYGSTLMKRDVGIGRGDRLEVVERRAALLARAELRRREDEHDRLVCGERVGHRRLVERRIRASCRSTPWRGHHRRRRPWASSTLEPPGPPATVGRSRATSKVRRTVSAGEFGASRREFDAPRAGLRQVDVEDVHAALILDRPDEGAVDGRDRLVRVAARGCRRRP